MLSVISISRAIRVSSDCFEDRNSCESLYGGNKDKEGLKITMLA